MPTYVYKCENCGYKFEKFQKITAKKIEKCPKCEGKVKRLIFGSGVIFKSDGFYSTDYNNKKSVSKNKESKEQVNQNK